MNSNKLSIFSSRLLPLVTAIVVTLTMRFATLGHLPFLDASDSRYALIAKLMADDGEFFVPKTYRDGVQVPFWSKPPFHFWLEALSMRLLGESEFATRLPSFLAALLMLALTGYCGHRLLGREQALLAVLLLATSGLFYFVAGTTLVDMTLSAAVTGAMVSVVLGTRTELRTERVVWSYLVSLFLAMGFLTKGPIAILFPASALTLWTILRRETNLLQYFPWKKGGLLFLLLTAPVFLIQEHLTPGYLRYFFLNENLLRYLVKDYGTQFGSGHRQPYGSSWIFLIAGFLPWTFLLIPGLSRERRSKMIRDPALLYFTCWVIGPTAVLTFARQLLATYLIPTFGGLALLLSASYFDYSPAIVSRRITTLVRVFALTLALMSLGVFLWTARDGFTAVHAVTSLGILWCFFSLLLTLGGRLTSVRAISMSALAVGLFYTSQTLNLCKYSEQQYSVAAIVNLLAKEHKIHRPLLYFPFGVPNSAYLYATQRLVDGQNAMTLNLRSENELILLRDKQMREFLHRFGPRFEEVLRQGKWRVLHAEGHPGNCRVAMLTTHGRRHRRTPHNPSADSHST